MQGFQFVYNLMQRSFPKVEYRNFEVQLALLEREDYHIYTYVKNGSLTAFYARYMLPGLTFIEHIAVEERYRGQGLGSQIMRDVIAGTKQRIVLEVEPPADSTDAARRVRFYEKLGFHLNDFSYEQPALRQGGAAVPLQLMSYPQALDEKNFGQVKQNILKHVYGI
ncbi:Ribosomal protein S18 acetylase RimI [Terribacillus aidingensis]|uniref:Ribosomal protein S18 acetylase RimI n=1 Tax=Terribacillus aidingensis TaxID=586416 RepID=A0A285P7D0_9BACI|nr:GNAT family N-acetyltransferase [Terribacillus aidingensis]SNZ15771.1 Ribosomal protein S18 acetylase RimI [Terribacillus aidingensis]